MQITDVDIRRAAMDLLARREHGAEELKTKLIKRFRKAEQSITRQNAYVSAESDSHQDGAPCATPFAASEAGFTASDDDVLPLEERVDIQIERLRDEGLQSDSRLAEAFIRSRANRGQGPVKIKMELRQKGIADGLISEALATADQDWFELASQVAERKFREPPQDPKDKARRSRFLQQRGFTFDHISALDDA
ncbi:MAG: regulatory protein RecX [Pseudomonadales bacterium]